MTMAYYGRDYSGRNNWMNRGENGIRYDSEYGGGGYGRGWSTDRGQGWSSLDRGIGWGERGRTGGFGNLDERWRSGAGRQGRPAFDEDRMGGYGGWRGGSYGSTNRGYLGGQGDISRGYDRGMTAHRRPTQEYDQDFGDRLRRGWNRFREEARDWMGRGYDRGW
jgi:hypothetical protein